MADTICPSIYATRDPSIIREAEGYAREGWGSVIAVTSKLTSAGSMSSIPREERHRYRIAIKPGYKDRNSTIYVVKLPETGGPACPTATAADRRWENPTDPVNRRRPPADTSDLVGYSHGKTPEQVSRETDELAARSARYSAELARRRASGATGREDVVMQGWDSPAVADTDDARLVAAAAAKLGGDLDKLSREVKGLGVSGFGASATNLGAVRRGGGLVSAELREKLQTIASA